MNNKEIRTLSAQMRADDDSRIIEGYAIRFNEWSRDLGGFVEIIKKEAVSDELLQNSDVVMNINHDNDKMVARYTNGKGTLNLELRDEGLYFTFTAPPTPTGDELLYNVRVGNLAECSFCFTLPNEGGDRWYREDDVLKREILNINGLYDCSIVTHAAYPTTSCSARGEQMVKTSEEVNKVLDNLSEEIDKM